MTLLPAAVGRSTANGHRNGRVPPESSPPFAAAQGGSQGTTAPVRAEAGASPVLPGTRAPNEGLKDRIFNAQRLENLGLLAAGIAHDLNNVLAPIVMTPSLLRTRVSDPADRQILDMLEQSAARATDLVRQILGFARGAAGEHHVLQTKYLIRDLMGLMTETFPKNIALEHTWSTDLWTVNGNPSQIHQALLNLCINARDAMPGGGTLRLRARNHLLDDVAAATCPGCRPGSWLVIEVEDTGTGMAPDVVARIWEPFFTTKEVGKGSGLGLPMVRNIVDAHGGFITLETHVGRGSTFAVHLPAAQGQVPRETLAPPPLPPRADGEAVLVVDDEPAVCEVTAATLARHGYNVHATTDAVEALGWFACHRDTVRLVVTDLKMPMCDGATVAAVLRKIQPNVRILCVTGQSDDPRINDPKLLDADETLLKPFSAVEVLAAARRLLHGVER